MADACRGSRASDGCLAHHRDTPPVYEHFVGAGLLARGSQLCPAFPKPCSFSDFVGQRLAAYSCGGSAGIAPASLLAPGQAKPGEPRQARIICNRTTPSSTCHLPLRHPVWNDCRNNGRIERLVIMQPDGRIELCARLHAVDGLMGAA